MAGERHEWRAAGRRFGYIHQNTKSYSTTQRKDQLLRDVERSLLNCLLVVCQLYLRFLHGVVMQFKWN
eukprot:9925147-Prorocentrum_lima.AAC.1